MLTLSRLAVMWCQDKRFQQWASVDGVTAARAFILDKCGIKSRTELDKNPTHAAGSGCAWVQNFGNGDQHYNRKSNHCRARAVRRLPIR